MKIQIRQLVALLFLGMAKVAFAQLVPGAPARTTPSIGGDAATSLSYNYQSPSQYIGGYPIVTRATGLNTFGGGETLVGNGVAVTTIQGSGVSVSGNQISNVSAGTAQTDAVNLGQVNALFSENVVNENIKLNTVQSQLAGYQGTTQSQINSLQNQVNANNKVALQGIAASSAVAGIPPVPHNKKFNIGVGVGGYSSQSAMAIGVGVNITDSASAKLSIGFGNSGSSLYSAGAAMSF
jgi:autotransporter adhesin